MNRRGFIAKVMAIPAIIAAAIPFLNRHKPWDRFRVHVENTKDIHAGMVFRILNSNYDGYYKITREADTYFKWNGEWFDNYRINKFFAAPTWNSKPVPYLHHSEDGEVLVYFGGIDVKKIEFYGTDYRINV